jgi:hypothetical protein
MQGILVRFLKEFREVKELKYNFLEVKYKLGYLESKLEKVVLTTPVESITEEKRRQTEKTLERKDVKSEETLTNDFSVDKYSNTTDFPLPLFDENNINPVFHLKQLDTYINMRNVPNTCKLTIALRSLNGIMNKQWSETMVNQIQDYENFKREFLKVWWSASQQSLVKCKLYQDKYDYKSNLTLSTHFFKYTTLASYLDPKPTEIEIIEALRYHYPPYIQRTLVNNQLKTIGGTLEVLRRLELINTKEPCYKNTSSSLNPSREIKGQGNVRKCETRQTRMIQEYPTSGDYRNKRKDNYRTGNREEYSYNNQTGPDRNVKSDHEENRITFTKGSEVNIPEN